MNPGELVSEQQVEQQLGVAAIGFLPGTGTPSDCRRIADGRHQYRGYRAWIQTTGYSRSPSNPTMTSPVN